MQNSHFDLERYPIGPHIQTWLGIKPENYKGYENTDPSEDENLSFQKHLLNSFEHLRVKDIDHLTALADELLAMHQPLLVLHLLDLYPDIWMRDSFQRTHTEGIAAMLVGEMSRAEICFRYSQNLEPTEPGSYANLLKIFSHDGRNLEFDEWLEISLNHCPNYPNIWVCAVDEFQKRELNVANQIKNLCKQYNSWMGHSLLADLAEDSNAMTKSLALQPFYDSGERSEDFLVEYTGSLGQAGEFDRIPPIIWQYQKLMSQPPSWKLKMHEAQAYLAMENQKEFYKIANIIMKDDNTPTQIKDQLSQVIKEEQENSTS